jgi:hypothetical protein
MAASEGTALFRVELVMICMTEWLQWNPAACRAGDRIQVSFPGQTAQDLPLSRPGVIGNEILQRQLVLHVS